MIYCRVSTKEQVEEGNSLATQEKICSEYALKNGYEIAKVFIEQGESAKNANRTELQQMLTYCSLKKNLISAVIAYKVDRIARNIDDYRQIRLLLKKHGVEIKSTSEHFEDTPAGRFMENIIANVAQFDNDVRTERSVGGMRDAIKDGRFVWGAPVGYDNVKIGGKSNIAPNDMAIMVRKAFEKVAENLLPVNEVRRQITKEGLTNRAGKPVSQTNFYTMLTNELYTGWIVGLGERSKGTFEPIITQELFDQVQRVLRRRTHRVLLTRRDNPDFPLRRFVFHSSGKKLTGCWSKGRQKKYPYYLFHIKGLEFKRDELEKAFMEYLDEFKLTDKQVATIRTRIKTHVIDGTEAQQKEIALAQKTIVELKQKQQSLIQKNLDGIIGDSILKDQLNLIENEMMRFGAIAESGLKVDVRDINKNFDIVSEYLKKPSAVWSLAPLQSKLKLQWFNFPQGVYFDGKEFRTTEICNLFNVEKTFVPSISCRVHPAVSKSNRSEDNITDQLDSINIVRQISALAGIVIESNNSEKEKQQ